MADLRTAVDRPTSATVRAQDSVEWNARICCFVILLELLYYAVPLSINLYHWSNKAHFSLWSKVRNAHAQLTTTVKALLSRDSQRGLTWLF